MLGPQSVKLWRSSPALKQGLPSSASRGICSWQSAVRLISHTAHPAQAHTPLPPPRCLLPTSPITPSRTTPRSKWARGDRALSCARLLRSKRARKRLFLTVGGREPSGAAGGGWPKQRGYMVECVHANPVHEWCGWGAGTMMGHTERRARYTPCRRAQVQLPADARLWLHRPRQPKRPHPPAPHPRPAWEQQQRGQQQ